MPWHLSSSNPKCSGWAVIKDSTDVVGCHPTKEAAMKHMAALYANEPEAKMTTTEDEVEVRDHPAEDLFRMLPLDEARVQASPDGNTLYGYAAVFNSWADIDNPWEGEFQEQFSPGAFKRTLSARGDKIKILFNHGMDPAIGTKPLGKPRVLREDGKGLYIEVPLDDTSYNRDLKASLASGALDGMSVRMNVKDDSWETKDGIEYRTITEAALMELGPVTFPAYEATTASIRSKAPDSTSPEPDDTSEEDPVVTSEEPAVTAATERQAQLAEIARNIAQDAEERAYQLRELAIGFAEQDEALAIETRAMIWADIARDIAEDARLRADELAGVGVPAASTRKDDEDGEQRTDQRTDHAAAEGVEGS